MCEVKNQRRLLCVFNIYKWHNDNKDSKNYKCKFVEGNKKTCSASLTINNAGNMVYYKPNHLGNHSSITNEFKIRMDAKIQELRELVAVNTTTPIAQLYQKMIDGIVSERSKSS